MSVEFTCGDPAALAGYLYNECDAAERRAIEAHLAACPACVGELHGLGAARSALAAWAPPDARLGFKITSADDSDEGRVLRPARWWQRPMPAWAQVAAAMLIFAVGTVLGMRAGAQTSATPASSTASVASTVSSQDLAALEQRLRAEMTSLRTSAATRVAAAPQPAAASGSDAAVLQRVRALLAESEQRQQQELALRLTQVLRDVDVQRRVDLARIEQTFGRMEGLTRPELNDQRQMLNYLIQRTGVTRPPQ